MQSKLWFYAFLMATFSLVSLTSCEKEDTTDDTTVTPVVELATLTTTEITDITTTTAKSGGAISDNGGADITAKGICWSTTQNPTISDSKTEDGTGKDAFTSDLADLTPNTTYYVKAYATNEKGTAYGAEVSFTTEEEQQQPLGPFSMLIDGVAYNVLTTTVYEQSGRYAISGRNGVENLIVWLPLTPTIGTHTISPFESYMVQYSTNVGGGGTLYTSNPGTMVITEYDANTGRVTGTFEFTGDDNQGNTIVVTEGKFDAYL